MKSPKLALGVCFSLLFLGLQGMNAVAAEWPKTVSIGTASVRGTFYYVGGAFVKIFEKMGIKATQGGSDRRFSPQPQAHSIQADPLCHIAQGSACEAWTGTGWAKQKHDNLRSVMAILPSYGHGYALRKKNITNFRDFNGKVVSGGPPGGTSDMYLRNIGVLLGLKYSRVVLF